jgi:phospholipid/cholesterol/gamma-HCH transport system substrate-binding protein
VRRYSDGAILRLGAISVVAVLVAMVAAFNLQKFPGFRGTEYHAMFSDASGLRPGNMVQVAGIRVGRVNAIELDGNRVVVDFTVKGDVDFGPETSASVEVLNLLGEKYLQLDPAGDGQLSAGSTIPLDRTESGYDIVRVLSDLSTTTEEIDTHRLGTALDTLSQTLDGSSDQIRATFDGVSRLSRTIASRDAELQTLMRHAKSVSTLLADRRGDLTTLMRQGDLLLQELRARREAIHALLVDTADLAEHLSGLVRENRAQLGPALNQVHTVLALLRDKRDQVERLIGAMGPYAQILGNIVGTGPWFDAYVVNLGGLAGEFEPGVRKTR